jgi:putative ABC transport system ATP-binding protein
MSALPLQAGENSMSSSLAAGSWSTHRSTLSLLAFAARAWGLPLPSAAVEEALEALAAPDQPDARALEAQLLRGASVAGFEVRPFSGTAEELLGRTHAHAPAFRLVRAESGRLRWVALMGQRLGVAMMSEVDGEPRALSPGEAATALQVSDESPWFFLEPTRPLDAAKGDGHHHPSPWDRLWSLLKPEASDLWVVLSYAVLVGLLSLAVPVAVQALVNTVGFGVLRQPVVVLTGLVLGGLIFAAILRAAQVQVVELLQRRLFVRAAVDAAGRLAQAQVAAFDGRSGPELVNRFFDVLTLQKGAATMLLDGLGIALQIAIGALLMAFYHPLLLAFDVVLLGALAAIVVVLGRGGLSTSLRESQAKYAVVAWLEELAQPHTIFHSAGGRALASQRVQRLCADYLQARQDHFRVILRQTVGTLALHAVASAALLGVGAMLVLERQLTLGQLVAAELVASAMLAGVSKLGKYLETGYDMLTAADKLGYLIDVPLERAGGEESASVGPMAVRLDDVVFAYGRPQEVPHHGGAEHGEPNGGHGQPSAPVFQGMSAALEPGRSVGIVGGDSGGLSTLADLLLGYRAPTGGLVAIDGVDVKELRLDSLRARVGLARGAELFDGTIAENVRAGRASVGLEEVRSALALVGLLDVVQSLPKGIHQPLGPQGSPLSGGQASVLGLARAVAGSPRLLLIDGVLDELSDEVQQRLLEPLLGPEAPWTLVVLTHHQRLAARCQRTLRLDQGTLVDISSVAPRSPEETA